MKTTTILFIKDKDCKHSIRFAATNEDAPIGSVYVDRRFLSVGTTACQVVLNVKEDSSEVYPTGAQS